MRRLLIALACCALLAGCGSTAAHDATSSTTTTAAPDATVHLEDAVRRAVSLNADLSNWVLWHDSVPSWASRSTGGPALGALRSAAAERQRRHLRLRGISPHFDVLSIALAPSYTQATVTVREQGELRSYSNGRPLGKASKVKETYRLQLRRSSGKAPRFVVWKVEAT